MGKCAQRTEAFDVYAAFLLRGSLVVISGQTDCLHSITISECDVCMFSNSSFDTRSCEGRTRKGHMHSGPSIQRHNLSRSSSLPFNIFCIHSILSTVFHGPFAAALASISNSVRASIADSGSVGSHSYIFFAFARSFSISVSSSAIVAETRSSRDGC